MTIRGRITRVLLVAAVLAAANPVVPVRVLAADNPVVAENKMAGSNGWRLGSLVADDTAGQIKGYASATSVSQNAPITLYVSVNPAQTYSIDVYRVGWYGGMGGRLRLHVGGLAGVKQQACLPDAGTGLIACGWTPSYSITIPGDWTSGVYLAMLTNALGYENYIPFVVKDGRPAAFLYQQSVATDEAYNNYPDDRVTGKSLYAFNSYGANTVAGDARAVKVSFDRPYRTSGAPMFLTWEVQLVRWLEQSGYDVTYSTDVDTHANGGALLNRKGLLVGGHGEYWSLQMYNAVEAARDAGVNVAFFGADVLGWQVRFEASAQGAPNRVVVCYKDAAIDPVSGPTTTVQWRNQLLNRPGQALTGLTIAGQVDFSSNADYVVTNSSHWVYSGTGFKDGDTVHGIVGYEMDRFDSNFPAPVSTNRTLLSWSPFTDSGGAANHSNSSIYQAPSGAWVFATGTMSWSWALDNYDAALADSRIQRMTSNVLNAFL
ncbi:MAG: Ig domain-containing protein group 1 domain-containing protein, partial [Chloroflexi bacterium]